MTEAMPFLQKYDITFLRPPAISAGDIFFGRSRGVEVYPRQRKSPLEHQKSASITVCLQIFTFSFFTLHYSLHCKMCWRMAIVYFTAPRDCRHPAPRAHNHYLQ